MMSGMYQRFQRNHLVELSNYPHQTALQLDQTTTFRHTNSLTAQSNYNISSYQQSYSSVKLQHFVIPTALQLSQTTTFRHTNSLTAQSNYSIETDQFPFVKPFKMHKYEMFACVLSSLS
jgi:hypothetical protein